MIKYGGGTADFAFYKGDIIPGQKYTLWDENDNQLTTLWDAGGVPIPDAQVQADVFGMVEYYTEDGVFPVYAKAVGDTSGLKVRMDPSTITEDLYDSIATTSGLASRTVALETSQDEQDVEIATISDQINAILDELGTPGGGGGGGSASRAVIYLDDTAFGAIGDGISDDAPAWQLAFDELLALGGGTLFVPAGTYKLNSEIEIKSSCRVVCDPNATMIRGNSSMQYIFKNFNAAYAPTVYSGRGNIEWYGGVIDGGAAAGLTTSCTSMIFAHARDITVKGTIFQNVVDWHGLELNAVNTAHVIDCTFRGFKLQTAGRHISEGVQIDLAKDSGVLPGIGAGAYDNTTCQNIFITGCSTYAYGSLTGFGRLCGSHSAVAGLTHKVIKVANCSIYDSMDYGINALNWENVVITGNSFANVNGVFSANMQAGGSLDMYLYSFNNNVVQNCGVQNSSPAVLAYAVAFNGVDASAVGNVFRDVVIANNSFYNSANTTFVIKGNNVADFVVLGNTFKVATVAGACEIAGCSRARFLDNKLSQMTGRGVYVHDLTNVVSELSGISANTFDNNGDTDLDIRSQSCVVNGNVISGGAGNQSVYLASTANRCIVTGNMVNKASGGSKTTGVNIDGPTRIVLVGNQLWGWTANSTQSGASGQNLWIHNSATVNAVSMANNSSMNDIGL